MLAAFYSMALMIVGFEIALPLGVVAGLVVFIPYVGFTTGQALALLAALVQFDTSYGFGAVLSIYGIGQILESFFLTPRFVGERIGLHPPAVIFALLTWSVVRLFRRTTGAASQRDPGNSGARIAPPISGEYGL